MGKYESPVSPSDESLQQEKLTKELEICWKKKKIKHLI